MILKTPSQIFLLIVILLFPLTPSISFAVGISIITSQDLPIYEQAFEGFQNIYKGETRRYDLQGNLRESEKVIRKIREQPPDLIVAIGLLAATVAKENFRETPIVFCAVVDPERFSLIGDNLTGITLNVPVTETLSQIRNILPEARKLGVLYDPRKSRLIIEQAENLGKTLGFSMIPQKVSSELALPDAMRSVLHKSDLLWIIPDSTIITPNSIDYIFLNTSEEHIPIITFSEDLLKKGALAAFSPDYVSIGEQAGHLVLSILSGKSPGTIPIQPADKTRLIINQKIAKKMGLNLNTEAVDIDTEVIFYE